MGKHRLPEELMDLPGPSPDVEAARRAELRKHQLLATGLLVIAAVTFLACSWWQSTGSAPEWLGYVRASAEAGMVGGIADWFAVTALFKHPLGIRIPHTALLPRKKDQLGTALSGFVGENFLNARLITEKVSQAKVPERIGNWLAQPENAHTVSREVGRMTVAVVSSIDTADAEELVRTQVVSRAADPLWGPPAGRVLETLIADGKTEPIVDSLISWARTKVYGMEEIVITAIDDRMPNWAPRFAKELVGERVYRELVSFVEDVDSDKHHDARRAVHRFIGQLAQDLQYDQRTIDRVENLKAELMASEAVGSISGAIWANAAEALISAAEDPTSALRLKAEEMCMHWGNRIQHDEKLRSSLDERLTSAVQYLAENYSGEFTAIISETVHRWDAKEASRRIELMVGKDLQYIRVNGTVVGALAGLAIYIVNKLLFGV